MDYLNTKNNENINENSGQSNITNEICCICLNTNELDFIILNCCKQSIHRDCFIEWICYEKNELSNCAICRQEIKLLQTMITQGIFIDSINKYYENEEYGYIISKNDILRIFNKYYKDLYFTKITIISNGNETGNENGISEENNNQNNTRIRLRLIDKVMLLWVISFLFILLFYIIISR